MGRLVGSPIAACFISGCKLTSSVTPITFRQHHMGRSCAHTMARLQVSRARIETINFSVQLLLGVGANSQRGCCGLIIASTLGGSREAPAHAMGGMYVQRWSLKGPAYCGPRQRWDIGATSGHSLIFIVADPTSSLFRSVDQVLPAAKCRMVSVTEASEMSRVGFGQQDVHR